MAHLNRFSNTTDPELLKARGFAADVFPWVRVQVNGTVAEGASVTVYYPEGGASGVPVSAARIADEGAVYAITETVERLLVERGDIPPPDDEDDE